MEEFLQWSESNHLMHLPTRGALFTWSNGIQGRSFTEKRLDRAICNQQWIHLEDTRFASQFRFHQMWALHLDCANIIASCWNNNVVGCPMYVLNKKLKILKEKLKDWNKETLCNVQDHVKNAENNLQQIQHLIAITRHTDDLLDQEKKLNTIKMAIYKEQFSTHLRGTWLSCV